MAFNLLSGLSSKRNLLRLGSLMLKAFIFLPLPLLCQNRAVSTVSIPFTFAAGNHTLPAGDYVVNRVSDNIYSLRDSKGSSTLSMVVFNASVSRAPDKGKLVFRNYGGQYFLSSIWTAGSRYGLQTLPGRAEKELLASTHGAARQGALVALDIGMPQQHP